MDQKTPRSSVGSDARTANLSMVEGASLDPGDQATFDEFEMEQASSLSHNVLQ
jgi:hypothetical protein